MPEPMVSRTTAVSTAWLTFIFGAIGGMIAGGCIVLAVHPDPDHIKAQDARVRWANLKRGKEVTVVAEAVRRNFLWVEVEPGIKGQISAINACTDPNVVKQLDKHFQPGQVFSAQVSRVVASKKYLDLILHGTASGPASTCRGRPQGGPYGLGGRGLCLEGRV